MGTEYDIIISFAGEDRAVAEQIADGLRSNRVSVFYDEYEQANLWGKDLYHHLSQTYSENASYCLVLISEHYVKKNWTKLELRSAQERAFKENREYILPVRLDDTKVPGISDTIGYLDINTIGVDGVIKVTLQKLGKKLATSKNVYVSSTPKVDIGSSGIPKFGKRYSDLNKELQDFSRKISQDGKDEIQVKRSKELIAERFKDSIWPFFESLVESTEEFYQFFTEYELQYMVDRTHFGSNFTLSEIKDKFLEAIVEKEYLREMGIEIRLIALKKVPENPWTLYLKTNMEFQDYRYIINPHHNNGNTQLPQLNKLYHQSITIKEIEDYVHQDGLSIMNGIKSYYYSFEKGNTD